MKKQTIIITFILVCSHLLFAQKTPYNVVFDMTSDDTLSHKMALRWISEVVDNNPRANVEIVFYGKSLGMITQGKSIVAEKIKTLVAKENVAFKVCAIAMKNNNIDQSMLLPGVQTVPDGIYEIISKQHDGWGYIKVSH
jgi:intracellular sulfur oxidation DsrE/DsrF family protein